MERLKLWARNGEAVRQAIELGERAHLETAREECTEACLLFGSERGLWQSWAEACPAPRGEPEMSLEVVLPAPRAARCAGLSSMRNAGYGRRAARVLGALGDSVAVIEPAHGLSWRGPSDAPRLRGEVVRKRLVQRAEPAALSQPAPRPPQAPRGAGKVRERASRRAVKQAVDVAAAAARAPQVAAQWVGWSNRPVGVSLLPYARLGRGRRLPLLDTTPVEGRLETGPSAGSGVVKTEAGPSARGAKLATVRTLLDSAGLRTQGALAPIHGHDVAVGRPVLAQALGGRPGDGLLEERGGSDGATLSAWHRPRQVEVILPLNAPMLATQEAMQRAAMAATWAVHPSRGAQHMAWGRGVAPMGPECPVPLHAGVMRFWKKQQKRTASRVLGTTAQELSASWIVRHAAARPAIAQDDEQRHSGGWHLQTLSATCACERL